MIGFKETRAAHAKLNLTLDVGPRRDDGYHDIDSLVVRLTPADEVTLQVRAGSGQVRLVLKDKRPDAIATPPLPRGDENLVVRAARAARARWAPDAGIDLWITLIKRLPTEAGLGGGSGDAAAVLQLCAEALGGDPTSLHELATQIGSDVPLFLLDVPVRMQGRGERIAPAPIALPPIHGIVVRPGVGMPTGPAYAALDAVADRVPGAATGRLLRDGFSPDTIGNDFEAILPAFPGVAEAHRTVAGAGAVRALLCGSGSAIFGLARDPDHARDLTRRLVASFPWIKMVSALP